MEIILEILVGSVAVAGLCAIIALAVRFIFRMLGPLFRGGNTHTDNTEKLIASFKARLDDMSIANKGHLDKLDKIECYIDKLNKIRKKEHMEMVACLEWVYRTFADQMDETSKKEIKRLTNGKIIRY